MHCVNCSIFFDAFLQQSWISDENKARLLEWKGRIDLCMYTSRRSPEPLIDEIVNYKPKIPGSWDKVFERVQNLPDDGHASKLVRALAHGEAICKPYENDPKFRIQGSMWLQLGHMGNAPYYLNLNNRLTAFPAIDSVESPGEHNLRSSPLLNPITTQATSEVSRVQGFMPILTELSPHFNQVSRSWSGG